MSYTGIVEIDMVLLGLYSEQVWIEKTLQHEPKDKVLSERHRRVRVLADELLQLGRIIQRSSGVAQENS